ncbi:flippase [Solibacillus sp. CAU 1738]|uniref:flippase n=1 Tax=Solibacillus sp. CAU 1738 TaxID=3140363 RepID=UPI003261B199
MRNTGWLLFEQIFRMGLSLVVTSLMARYLGTENFGLINYSLAYIMIFTTVSNLGIDNIIVNEIIKNREETGKVIGTTIYLRLASSVISVFLIFLIVKYMNVDQLTIQFITLIQSISLLFVVFNSIEYWFQSNLQSKYVVMAKSTAFTIVSIWRLMLIFSEKSIYYFAVATAIEAFVISVCMVAFYIKFKGPRLHFSLQTAKKLLAKSYHFFIAGLLIMIYTQIDKIMLGKMTDVATVGIYAAAMTISSLWVFVPYALIESARPIIMASKSHSETLYIKKYKQLFCSIIWISIGASIVISLFSHLIVVLIYGNQFSESINVLVILIWSRIFSLIGSTRAIWLTVENLGKFQVVFVGIGAFLNVGLNLMLIPMFGAIGAAIATLFAEVISTFFAVLIFKKTRPLFKLIIESFLFKGIKT